MLRWPERARSAIRFLFEPLQDIDVYVEDTNDEAFYRCLLNHASAGQVKIARVLAKGGRGPVLTAAASHNHSQRRALFIVDGDLPWVNGEPTPQVPGLHCHEAYCVENLLLCQRALNTVLSQDTNVTDEAARERLAFSAWRQRIAEPLVELFAAFATAHHYCPAQVTVGLGVGRLCAQVRGTAELDPHKVIEARDAALAAAGAVADAATVNAHYQRTVDRLMKLQDPLTAVSGKDFLLPLIGFHLGSLGCRIKKSALRMRLASAGDVGRFARLATALGRAARGQR